MKNNFTSLAKELMALGKRYLMLQIDVAKLSLVEKLSLLLAGITMGLIAVLCICFMLLLLSFAAADLFKHLMCPALAYTATAGVVAIILLLIYLLRKQIIINPIARLLSKLIINPQSAEKHE